jgi:hypothetical protein
VQPTALPRAAGVTSAYPVVLLASGMNVPDDLLYLDADGSVLVGEHGDGHISHIVAPGQNKRLPQVVPEAEGIAQVDGVTYVADQYNSRVVALTPTGMKTLVQLVPVPSGENLDGIAAAPFGGLVVPDSAHGTVLFVDTTGHVTRRVGGFSRPAGAAQEVVGQGVGILIADENASAVFEMLGLNGSPHVIARNLPGVDDVVRTQDGHVLVILPGSGRLYDASAGRNLAAGLRNPQGLGFDGAQNVLLTESDAGRLDLVVKTFAAEVPSGTIQLQPGQPVCIGVLRAPGYTSNIAIHEVVGALPLTDPGTGSQGEILPARCPEASCTITLVLRSNEGDEFAHFSYRNQAAD